MRSGEPPPLQPCSRNSTRLLTTTTATTRTTTAWPRRPQLVCRVRGYPYDVRWARRPCTRRTAPSPPTEDLSPGATNSPFGAVIFIIPWHIRRQQIQFFSVEFLSDWFPLHVFFENSMRYDIVPMVVSGQSGVLDPFTNFKINFFDVLWRKSAQWNKWEYLILAFNFKIFQNFESWIMNEIL